MMQTENGEATVDEAVLVGAAALMKDWFPRGHGGLTDDRLAEDLAAWESNAMLDAEVVVRALMVGGLLSLVDGAMVVEVGMENDQPKE